MTPATRPDDGQIEAVLLSMVGKRGLESSACPSEVARAIAPGAWRDLMPHVRRVASLLALQGKIEITQGGQAVSTTRPWKGPVRLRLPGQRH